MKVKNIVLIVIALAVCAGAFFYIRRDLKQTTYDVVSEEGYPNLDKPVEIAVNLPEETQEMAREKIRELTDFLKKDNSSFNHWLDLASYRKLIGDYDAAREIWEYMITKWPESGMPLLSLGGLYGYYLHDFSKAEEYFLKSLEKNPSYITGYAIVYDFYKDNGMIDSAREVLSKGLEQNPDNAELLELLSKHGVEN